MSIAQSFIPELEQEAATTRRVLERVPDDKLAWKPHPKSMSLGQLALHIANLPGFISEMGTLDEFPLPDFTPATAGSTAQLLAALEDGVTKAKAFLTSLDDERLAAEWRVVKDGRTVFALPRTALIRSLMLNHWYHHRGQLSVYLRELNVPLPSIYGPSADENPLA
jgi:uncharacterized damage-inducible protein DinB